MDAAERRRRASSFGAAADAYDRARPGYPAPAVAWLAGDGRRDIVDVGAGTGRLTALLVAAGHRVVAVEPDDAMRAVLAARLPGVVSLAGSAEAIGVPDASADVVTAAQAFHWFDPGAALREAARILRPGGVLALAWNVRDAAAPPHVGDADVMIDERDVAPPVGAAAEAFGPFTAARFPHRHALAGDALLELVQSRSGYLIASPGERAAIRARAERLLAERSRDGILELPYTTLCFRARRR